MTRMYAAAGALALAVILIAGECLAQPAPSPKPSGGNKALMEDWVKKKRALRDQALKHVRHGRPLPRNGSVSFEAAVKPDPKKPGKVNVGRIHSFQVSKKPKNAHANTHAKANTRVKAHAHAKAKVNAKANTHTDAIFAPRTPPERGTVEQSIPMGGATREQAPIVEGRPVN